MSLLLAIHSYPGANHRHEAHAPLWRNSGADSILGIGTTCGKCKWPSGIQGVDIGADKYISNDHLPRRLVDTMRLMLLLPYDRYCIIEWDCLFFKPLPEFAGMAGFIAGGGLPGAKAQRFYHVPWCFDWTSGRRFVATADRLMPEVSGHETSPDVFFGWVCETAGLEVTQPWDGFTRNSLDNPGDLELARQAYLNGVTALHGYLRYPQVVGSKARQKSG